MLAPSSTTTRRPALGRRGLARGSALGVGLFVAAGAFAPAALADDETTGDTPTPEVDQGSGDAPLVAINDVPAAAVGDVAGARPGASLEGFFGRGKSVAFQVSYDEQTAPKGLDLSGAVFTLTGPAGSTYSCTTGPEGSCAVSNAVGPYGLPASGDFSVTQTGHPVGLAAAAGAGSVHLCGFTEPGCSVDPFEPVVNDSLFRSPVVSSVEDAVTARGIAGAGYTLTGPGYVLRPGLGDAAASYLGDGSPQTVRTSSAADGGLTFPGWFLPGTGYALAPDGAVDGYSADADTTGIEIAPSTGALPVSLTRRLLTPIAVPAPVDPIVPAPAPTTSQVSAPGPAPTAGRNTRPGRVAAPAATPVAESAVVEPPVAVEPPAPVVPPARRTFDPSDWTDTPVPSAGGPATPALTTVSSSFPDKRLTMALGGVFLTVVLVGVGLMRRHARRRA